MKKGLEFGFSWMFAILVGIIILFIAIYAANKFVKTERIVSDTFVSAEFSNLLNPIETNLEDSKYVKIGFIDDTRIFNECDEAGNFGRQRISTSSKIGVGDTWGDKSVRTTVYNKYLFSEEVVEGKEIHAVIKPLKLPYKVADLTFIYSGDYCFVNPYSDVEDEINDLSVGGYIGVNVSDSILDCPESSTSVCFNQIGCDVNLGTGSVEKNGKTIYFNDDTLYGAIFSDPEIYECQLKRLVKRDSELAQVYATKMNLLASEGCYNDLGNDLRDFAGRLDINDSLEYVRDIVPLAEELRRVNDGIVRCNAF